MYLVFPCSFLFYVSLFILCYYWASTLLFSFYSFFVFFCDSIQISFMDQYYLIYNNENDPKHAYFSSGLFMLNA